MVVDDSGSMVPWWPATLDAINMFFNDPGSDGIGVGVQFFGSDCNVATYATPRVGIAPLPGSIPALQAAFPLIPIQGTATVPAMEGAIQHARQWSKGHPHSKTLVLQGSELTAPLATCEAVIAEACYLLRGMAGAPGAVLQNLATGVFRIPLRLDASASEVKRLMHRYRDVPMDLADGCLVRMADELGTGDILTLDSDFEIYRWRRSRAFRNLLT